MNIIVRDVRGLPSQWIIDESLYNDDPEFFQGATENIPPSATCYGQHKGAKIWEYCCNPNR